MPEVKAITVKVTKKFSRKVLLNGLCELYSFVPGDEISGVPSAYTVETLAMDCPLEVFDLLTSGGATIKTIRYGSVEILQ